jgi:dynein light chain Tctex-type 1
MSERLTLADDCQDVVRDVVNRVFMPEATYQHSRVPQLVQQISDLVVQRLVRDAKLPRKYIAHCAVLQKNGAGFHALSACAWNAASDAVYVYKAENKAMICVLTIYGVTM